MPLDEPLEVALVPVDAEALAVEPVPPAMPFEVADVPAEPESVALGMLVSPLVPESNR